jgi:hypothetical protein
MRRGGRRKRTPVTRPRTKEARGHEEELCTRNRRMAARRNGYPVVSGRLWLTLMVGKSDSKGKES